MQGVENQFRNSGISNITKNKKRTKGGTYVFSNWKSRQPHEKVSGQLSMATRESRHSIQTKRICLQKHRNTANRRLWTWNRL
jgi:hypothetical protein